LRQHARHITHLSPAWYTIDSNLSITLQTQDSVIRFARDHRIALHPLIRNQGSDPHVAHEILKTGQRRSEAAERITDLVLEHDFAGINLDFEGPFGADRDRYSDFVARLSQLLHPVGRWVTVDVGAQVRPGSAFATKRSVWAEPFDYAALGRAADAVMIMAYEYSYSQPGPVSPLWWFRQVVAFARTQIPQNKLVIGLPFYGHHWVVQGGRVSLPQGVHQKTALDLLARSGARLERPAMDATPRFSWRDGQGTHIVHFEDEQSLAAKMREVQMANVAGIAIWRLGQEKASQWDVIARWL
jgi:spore germination protein YaaH